MWANFLTAIKNGLAATPFDYYGQTPGRSENKLRAVIDPVYGEAYQSGLIHVETDENTGRLKVKLPPLRTLTSKPKRLASGHGACPGCGIFPGLELVLPSIEGYVVTLFQTGCGYVTSAGYPNTSHKQTFIHNLFQNGAATLFGTVEAFYEMKARGEIDVSDEFTFVMVTVDSGLDIGMSSAIGTALRNHRMIIIEYDNEGYMNTGSNCPIPRRKGI